MINRIAPTRRPEGPAVGRQTWRDLLFLHWPVAAEDLRPLIPPELELDLFEGQAYVGLIPFAMRRVRPRFVPSLLGFNFLETNVRTYVHDRGRDPGVYFFSLEAASWVAAQAARRFWGLPYHHAAMTMKEVENRVEYSSVRKSDPQARLELLYEKEPSLGTAWPGSLEHFLLERYRLYSRKGGALQKGQVHHRPYPISRARVLKMKESLVESAGIRLESPLPPLAHYSPGVDVEIFALQPAR